MSLLYLVNRIVAAQECDATKVKSMGERWAHNKKINSACGSLLYFAKNSFQNGRNDH